MDKITIFFSNRDDFLCIELSILLMPCFAMLGAVRQRSSRVLACKLPDAFDGSKKLCGRFPQSFRVYWCARLSQRLGEHFQHSDHIRIAENFEQHF